jgi:hypothetical protein
VLLDMKLIELIFTCDGKEYLTSQQLVREIKDEVYLAGGRARSGISLFMIQSRVFIIPFFTYVGTNCLVLGNINHLG